MGRWGAGAVLAVVSAAAVALGGDLPPIQVRVETEVYSVLTERIEIHPGLSESYYPEVKAMARLSLGSVPEGARVTLDGEPRGRTPLRLEEVPLGMHELLV